MVSLRPSAILTADPSSVDVKRSLAGPKIGLIWYSVAGKDGPWMDATLYRLHWTSAGLGRIELPWCHKHSLAQQLVGFVAVAADCTCSLECCLVRSFDAEAQIGECMYFVVGMVLLGLMEPAVAVAVVVGVRIVDQTAGKVVAAAAH